MGGAGLLALGVFSRPVAASMATTMIVAVIFHLLNTGPEDFPLGIPKAHSYNFELAAMYVLVLGYFTVSGAGKFSVDEQVLGGELNFYSGLLDKSEAAARRSKAVTHCEQVIRGVGSRANSCSIVDKCRRKRCLAPRDAARRNNSPVR